MASTSTQLQDEASLPSTSSFQTRKRKLSGPGYDVFLSFRGDDTRYNFIDHLYRALNEKGIITFKDDKKVEGGEPIYPTLLTAIEESRFAVVVFSENYAFSKWCLEELVCILECEKTKGLIVLPVFYKVDPSHLRKQEGSVGEAFIQHERWKSSRETKEEKEKVQKWRDALTQAANISGWDSKEHRFEAELVQKIVKRILGLLEDKGLSIPDYVVGLETRVAEVISLLGIGLDDSRSVGIFGMGGIGKTTIAKAVYNQIRCEFDASSYLENVRETCEKHGLASLQESLISDILFYRDINVRNLDQGRSMIMTKVQRKRVLVVLDDVSDEKQVEDLIGKLDCFGVGSRIIITTRNSHIFNGLEVRYEYTVKELNDEEALELFCHKAFGKNQPTQGYEELTKSFVHHVGGVPLALDVLGSLLKRQSIIEWQSAFDRIRDEPVAKIHEVLKLSYDGLDSQEDKDIFLDIACFFKGKSKDFVIEILDACGFHASYGIRVLQNRALVTIRNNMIDMHDLIQEMGRHIVYEEHRKQPSRRSRLWKCEDIYCVLTDKRGSEAVEAIFLDSHETKQMSLSPDAFSQMSNLRLLQLMFCNVQLPNGLDYLPNGLRLLVWPQCPLRSLPPNSQWDNLVKLEMPGSCLIQSWSEGKCLNNLKYVDLTDSRYITKIPDCTQVTNLRELDLEGCPRLVEINPSIEAIKSLMVLNLGGCKSLKVLPIGCWLKSLKLLILSGCSRLKNVSEVLAFTECLTGLYLDGTGVEDLPIEHLSNLQIIWLRDCKELTSLPSGICQLKRLAYLSVSGCSKLSKLPENIGELRCLEDLRVDFTAIKQLPSSIVRLKNLQNLSCEGCNGRVTPTRWNSLLSSFLMTKEHRDPIGFELPSLLGLRSLTTLNLLGCTFSKGVLPEDLGSLSSLHALYLSGSNIISLPESIRGLEKLTHLNLSNCEMLNTLVNLPTNIDSITANGCTSLKTLPDPLPRRLSRVDLTDCHMLVKNRSMLPCELLRNYLKEFKNYYDQEYDPPQCTIFLPGREVPGCFHYQNIMGPCVRIQLMPDWHQHLRGFVACAVFEAKGLSGDSNRHDRVRVECYGMRDDIVYATDFVIGLDFGFQFDHLFLDYIPLVEICFELEANDWKTWTEIIFYFSCNSEMFPPVKCSVQMVYEDDEDWPNSRASVLLQSDPDEFELIEWIRDVVSRNRRPWYSGYHFDYPADTREHPSIIYDGPKDRFFSDINSYPLGNESGVAYYAAGRGNVSSGLWFRQQLCM